VTVETVLLYILGVVIIALGLGISIALHELGHLWPAKRFGVYVPKYMIGFGPTVWSKRVGETEYGVKALPLGGFVALSGMYPPEEDGVMRDSTTSFFDTAVQEAEPSEDPKRAFYLLPAWKRVIVMLGGPVMNLLLAVLAYAILLCGIGIPQLSTTIGTVNECVLPAAQTRQECAAGDPAAPAAAAGIRPGDRLLAIDGEPVTGWLQSTEIIREHAGEPIRILIERDGAELELTATPMRSQRYAIDDKGDVILDAAGEPAYVDVGFLGIGAAYETTRQPITSVLPAVGDNIVRVVDIIWQLPVRIWDTAAVIFTPGAERDPNGPLSVVGVGRLAGEIASIDAVPMLDKVGSLVGVFASLNTALFVFNLIPLLPLDGGHVLGAIWEAIRRGWAKLRGRPDPGPVDISKAAPITMVVVVLLGVMSLVLIAADIVKPITLL